MQTLKFALLTLAGFALLCLTIAAVFAAVFACTIAHPAAGAFGVGSLACLAAAFWAFNAAEECEARSFQTLEF